MSVVKHVLIKHHLFQSLRKQICTCSYSSWSRLAPNNNGGIRKRSYNEKLPLWQSERYAGHSKWANIKFKKMHKDNARAKVFGRLSLEIIQSVKESGADVAFNPRLDALITKAKAASMPKDKIETSIKNALRHSDEKLNRVILQARGPNKCGLLIDLLTPNLVRAKAEIRQILKRKDAEYISDGSVAFQFLHKGVIEVEAVTTTGEISEDEKTEAEEVAIMIGAEEIYFNLDERNIYQFICGPLEIYNLKKSLTEDFDHLKITSVDTQYLAKSLMNLPDSAMERADILIDALSDHPDVVNVYDNIVDYPSKTIKIKDEFS